MSSKLKTIQSEIEARLEAFFPESGVEIMSRLRGNISNDIAAKLAKKKIVVMCFPPSIGGIKPNVMSRLMAEDCRMQLRIVEVPTLNDTGVDAYEALERILSINGFKTSDGTLVSVASSDDASSDNIKAVEFIVELKMSLTKGLRYPHLRPFKKIRVKSLFKTQYKY